MVPAPTPHDIIAPPGVPFSPSLLVWLGLIAVAAGLLLLATILLQRLKKTERRPAGAPEDKIFALLNACKGAALDTNRITSLARLLRRYVSLAEGEDITSYTRQELEKFVRSNNKPSLQNLIVTLIPLEELRYRGAQSFDKDMLQSLHEAFSKYVDGDGGAA